ncbi:MAG: type II toxin-antitoxin system ParD family antitoxin [Bacteroidota bacterium]
MNVSLTPELEGFTRSLVEKGDYNSASEVVREALRLLKLRQERERLALKRQIDEAFESGPPVTMTEEDIRAMIGEHMDRLRAEVERGERPAPGGPGSMSA